MALRSVLGNLVKKRSRMSTHRSVGLNLNKVQNFPFATIQIAKTWWSLGRVDRTYIVIEFKRGSSLVELECRSQIAEYSKTHMVKL